MRTGVYWSGVARWIKQGAVVAKGLLLVLSCYCLSEEVLLSWQK